MRKLCPALQTLVLGGAPSRARARVRFTLALELPLLAHGRPKGPVGVLSPPHSLQRPPFGTRRSSSISRRRGRRGRVPAQPSCRRPAPAPDSLDPLLVCEGHLWRRPGLRYGRERVAAQPITEAVAGRRVDRRVRLQPGAGAGSFAQALWRRRANRPLEPCGRTSLAGRAPAPFDVPLGATRQAQRRAPGSPRQTSGWKRRR
jgi:hypothetical protein